MISHRRARDLKITSIVATPVDVPFREGYGPVRGDAGTSRKESVKYILRAGTNKGWVGLGETYAGANVQHLHRNAQKLIDIDFDVLQINRLPVPMDREYDAFELMVYDILGHELKVPAYQLLGDACRDHVSSCFYLPASAGRDEVMSLAQQAQNQGLDCGVVVQRDPALLRDCCQAVLDACGRTMRMIIAPFKPWDDLKQAQQALEGLKGFHILLVEGALPAEDVQGLATLCRSVDFPISLAMHVTQTPEPRPGVSALQALKHDACAGLTVEYAMAAFVRMADLAELAGMACRHAGEADLGILEAGYLHAAVASPACVWPCNIFGRRMREHDLLKTPLAVSGKYISVPHRAGLGVVLDIHAMDKYRVGDDIVLSNR